jgi:hypothetical protein
MTALYTSGTISLVNGSAVITGIDTAWETALIVGGTVYAEAEGNPLPILPDDSAGASEHPITDTQMTAAIKWQGATGTYKYALVRENTYTTAQAANSAKIAELLQQLNYPTIAAIAGIQGEQDHLILLTGPSTATIIPRTSLIQGDVKGPAAAVDRQLASFDGITGKLLRAISIVGTVSQSSGVPTGAIIERGSNANGTYVRFADGTQTCIMIRAIGGSGPGIRTFNLNYPAAFAAGPVLMGGAMSWGSSFRYAGPTTQAIPGTTSATSVGVEVTQSGAGTVDVAIVAEGRWF